MTRTRQKSAKSKIDDEDLRRTVEMTTPMSRDAGQAILQAAYAKTVNISTPPETGGDITFAAGKAPSAAGMESGREGRILWIIPDGPTLIMHGADSPHSFTLEKDGEVLFALPRDVLGEKYSLEAIVREIVQREIRLATIATIREVVKQELGASAATGKAASKVANDLREMGLDGKEISE